VIAYAKGGVLETVTPRTGLFFSEQTPAALAAAVRQFDTWEAGFRPEEARAQAQRFAKAAFHRAILAEVEALLRSPASSGAAQP
jgi:glycosyltransferase involved in cell wall biosynthesis